MTLIQLLKTRVYQASGHTAGAKNRPREYVAPRILRVGLGSSPSNRYANFARCTRAGRPCHVALLAMIHLEKEHHFA